MNAASRRSWSSDRGPFNCQPVPRPACLVGLRRSLVSTVPSALDVSATSLATISDAWEVVTFVYLQATGATDDVSFRITEPPRKGELLDSRNGIWCRLAPTYVTKASSSLRHALRYVPYRNEVGLDTLKYRARVNGRESQDAVATVYIERAGVTWQIITNASTGFRIARPVPHQPVPLARPPRRGVPSRLAVAGTSARRHAYL